MEFRRISHVSNPMILQHLEWESQHLKHWVGERLWRITIYPMRWGMTEQQVREFFDKSLKDMTP